MPIHRHDHMVVMTSQDPAETARKPTDDAGHVTPVAYDVRNTRYSRRFPHAGNMIRAGYAKRFVFLWLIAFKSCHSKSIVSCSIHTDSYTT
jgi:hypothetical protein